MQIRILKTDLIDWRLAKPIQDSTLKHLNDVEAEKLRESMVDTGFISPFFVWENSGVIYILDGVHRQRELSRLGDEGHAIPDRLPAIFIDCKDRTEACQMVLQYSSDYAKVSQNGFVQFVTKNKLNLNSLNSKINISNISLTSKAYSGLLSKNLKLQPYTRTHILLSFPPALLVKVQEKLKGIIAIPGVEYEQASN